MTFQNAVDKQQLLRHVKQTVEYIDLVFTNHNILRTLQPILTALHTKESQHHVLFFLAVKLDYHPRTNFFTGNWSPNLLQEAPETLKGENAFCFYWQELSKKLHISNCQISLSCDVLSAFLQNIYKRKVCYVLIK